MAGEMATVVGGGALLGTALGSGTAWPNGNHPKSDATANPMTPPAPNKSRLTHNDLERRPSDGVGDSYPFKCLS